MSQVHDLVGKKLGRLTVLQFAGSQGKCPNSIWACVCECGKKKIVRGVNLLSGQIKSCGCLRKEITRALGYKSRKHGHSLPPSSTYHSWIAMKNRCLDIRRKAFPNYGGRRISVCDRWLKFENFLADMGEKPPGLTIE
jgi:hypothetical protein